MPLKITLLGSAYPYRGGLASFNERLIEEFNKEGDITNIETFKLQYPNFLFPGKTQFSDSPHPESINIKRSVNSVNPINWVKIGKKIKNDAPDILIIKFWLPFMGPCFGTIAKIARKNKKTKVIAIIDNMIPHEKRIGDKMFTKYFVKHVDGFIAMSNSVLDDISVFSIDKPKLLTPHPLFDNFGKIIAKEEALSNLKLTPSFKYILFFGFVRDYKGLDLLLDAFSHKKLKNLPLKLIVAGEYYNNQQQYIDQINSLGIQDDVIIKNEFIPNEDVKNYFCAADIVAQPYKNATQSGVTQIGYHFEKPMLVTNVGGLPELVPSNIGYVTSTKPENIAEKLYDFFSKNKEEEFVSEVRKEKKKFTWDKMTYTIKKIYHDIQE